MAQVVSVAYATTNGNEVSGALYLNTGDTVQITYTFDASPGMRGGDRIQLSNGQYATYVSHTSSTATFTYTVSSGSTNTQSLGQTSTTIVPGDRTTPQSGFTYGVTSSTPTKTIVIDTVAPGAPAITGLTPDTDPVGDNVTASTTIGLSGTAEANSTVKVLNGGVQVATAHADNTGAWHVEDISVADKSSNSFTATSTDNAGNVSPPSPPFGVDVDTAICFCAGTLIRTPTGERAIESLSAGDLVLTRGADGDVLRPIRWIGRQTVSPHFADPMTAYPVRIAAGALGDDLPARDLFVSPEHALCLDGVLVQAGALVNGGSVRRQTRAELPAVFTYFHIELEHHGLVFAEGLLAETFVDNVTRRRFDNHAEYEALFGEETGKIPELDLPRVKAARQLPASLRDLIAVSKVA